jgi:hyperosmotically inducible protein
MRAIFAAGFAIALALVTPGWGSGEASAQQLSGEYTARVFLSIQRQVLEYPHYTVFDSVSARIDGEGIVTLTGKVTMPYKRDDIERRIRSIAGIQQVHNLIDVLPASRSDDELRVGIARAIYGNQTFRPYAARANPPIHVIVERGRVTLEGVVMDESERLLALSIARSFGSFAVTDSLVTEAEARREWGRL